MPYDRLINHLHAVPDAHPWETPGTAQYIHPRIYYFTVCLNLPPRNSQEDGKNINRIKNRVVLIPANYFLATN